MRNRLFGCLTGIAALLIASLAWSQTTQLAATAPSQEATAPATAPTITPAAQALLDQIRDAYAGLKTLDVAGTISFDYDAGGRSGNHKGSFTGAFVAPASFRHEVPDDLLIVANGQKAYIYKPDIKQYLPLEAPKDRVNSEDLPAAIGVQLQQQDPSLLYAIVKNASDQIVEGVQAIDRGPDTTIGGVGYPTLNIEVQNQHVTMVIDPKTHLLRQFNIDLKDQLVQRGVPQVKRALVSIDYTKSGTGAAVADASFAWTPPADASEAKPVAQGQDDQGAAAEALAGKAAPEFSLKDLKGQDVSLAAQKGSVVVLDFWATWCPPCRQSLPHLEQLHKDVSGKGAKVFAVDQGETRDVVSKFVDEQHLTMPILLDEQGQVGQKYQVSGIPQTVVIGKDGKVRKVVIGFGPGSADQIRESVEGAMKE